MTLGDDVALAVFVSKDPGFEAFGWQHCRLAEWGLSQVESPHFPWKSVVAVLQLYQLWMSGHICCLLKSQITGHLQFQGKIFISDSNDEVVTFILLLLGKVAMCCKLMQVPYKLFNNLTHRLSPHVEHACLKIALCLDTKCWQLQHAVVIVSLFLFTQCEWFVNLFCLQAHGVNRCASVGWINNDASNATKHNDSMFHLFFNFIFTI